MLTLHKWTGTYEDYMQSDTWRVNRNRALRRAAFECERCGSKRGLQVHHKTYEHLGCEYDEELEALCSTCHEAHHVDEVQEVRRIYLKVVSECLRVERFTQLSDLLEAVKIACARQRIPYDGPKIWKAVKLADLNRHGIINAPKPKPEIPVPPEGRPVTASEARETLRTLGIVLGDRFSMPKGPSDCEERARFQAEQIRGEIRAAEEVRRPRNRYIGVGRFKKLVAG